MEKKNLKALFPSTGKTTRYQCPVDFVSVSYKPCRSTFRKKLKKNSKELWLIKAPASFDPEWWVHSIFYFVLITLDHYITSVLLLASSFQGIQVPLSGLQTLKVPAPEGGDQRNYNVRSSAHGTSELYLLTSDNNSSESLAFGPTFSGLLNVCESYGDKSGNQPLQVIPAAPAPSIPPGLTHRFPLLNRTTSTQTCAVKKEPEELAKHFTEETGGEEEEGRKKKKKKQKKDKKIKLEQDEETDTLRGNENVSEIQDEVKTQPPSQEGSVLEEKKRKKKKKKDSEQEEMEQVVEEVMVKCEPEDGWSNDAVEGAIKKKKKKRKIDGD